MFFKKNLHFSNLYQQYYLDCYTYPFIHFVYSETYTIFNIQISVFFVLTQCGKKLMFLCVSDISWETLPPPPPPVSHSESKGVIRDTINKKCSGYGRAPFLWCCFYFAGIEYSLQDQAFQGKTAVRP